MTKSQARQLAEEINSGAIGLPRVQLARVFRFSNDSWQVRLLDCDGLRIRSLLSVRDVIDYVGWNAR